MESTRTPGKTVKRLAAIGASAALAAGGLLLTSSAAQAETPAPIFTNCTSSGCGDTIYVSRDGGETWSEWSPGGPVADSVSAE